VFDDGLSDNPFRVLWSATPPARRVGNYYSAAHDRYTSLGWAEDNDFHAGTEQNISTGAGVVVLRMILDSWVGERVTNAVYVCPPLTNYSYYYPEASNPVVSVGQLEFFNCGVYSARVVRAEEGGTTNLANHNVTINSSGDAVTWNVRLYHEIVNAQTDACGNVYGQNISDGGVFWIDFYMDFRESPRGNTNGTWKKAAPYEYRY